MALWEDPSESILSSENPEDCSSGFFTYISVNKMNKIPLMLFFILILKTITLRGMDCRMVLERNSKLSVKFGGIKE